MLNFIKKNPWWYPRKLRRAINIVPENPLLPPQHLLCLQRFTCPHPLLNVCIRWFLVWGRMWLWVILLHAGPHIRPHAATVPESNSMPCQSSHHKLFPTCEVWPWMPRPTPRACHLKEGRPSLIRAKIFQNRQVQERHGVKTVSDMAVFFPGTMGLSSCLKLHMLFSPNT